MVAAMPRFYFDFREDDGGCIDEIGEDFPDAEAARQAAFDALADAARDLGHQHRDGRVAVQIRDNSDAPFMEVAVMFEAKDIGK
jgi:hypothetical protein